MTPRSQRQSYWRRNLLYVAVLLFVWFMVSFLFGIVLVDELDRIQIGGFKLGFWFAQQGSIYVFVILIFVYVLLMNRLEHRAGLEERGDDKSLDEEVPSERGSSSTEKGSAP